MAPVQRVIKMLKIGFVTIEYIIYRIEIKNGWVTLGANKNQVTDGQTRMD